MKKLIAIILSLLIIILPSVVVAESEPTSQPAQNHYTVSSIPDIAFKETGEPVHLDVIPVELAWDTVYRDDTIHAYLLTTTLDCANIMDIMLTDTQTIAQAIIDVIDTNIVRMTFDTLYVSNFNGGNNIYLLVVYTE